MTFEKLLEQYVAKEDVEEEDVRDFFASPNERVRLVARHAVAQTAIRDALSAAASLGREQQYADSTTLSTIELLAGISDVDEPYAETLKQQGLQAVKNGQFESAMRYLHMTVNRGVLASNQRAARARRVMRYAYDSETEAALDTLARHFSPPRGRPSIDPPLRLVILCSAVQDEDGPTVITCKSAVHFRNAGFDVEVVSTETVVSANSRMSQRLKQLGIPFYPVVGETFEQKVRWLLSYFDDCPANAIFSTVQVHDMLGKLVGCVGVAPVQVYGCLTIEPLVGKYDLLIQGVSARQETQTRWPGRSRYFGTPHAMAEEIDAARPLSRAALDVPEDAVLFATFGRMTKCDKPEYLEALGRILKAEARAWLVLAGRDDFGVVESIADYFQRLGVGARVRYLGRRQQDGPRLLKTIDVYCDPYPWPGGQSLLDAMYAGLPIVAMRAACDPNLDPTGCGPTSALAEALLDGVVELAPPGGVDDYVRIARAYIADTELRARAGRRARAKVTRDSSMQRWAAKCSEAIGELVLSKANTS